MSQHLSHAFTLPQLCASSLTTAAVLFLFQGCAQSAPQQPQQSVPAAMAHTSAQSASQDVAPAAAAATADDWKAAESSHLVNVQHLTFAKDYVKAGEAYFDPTSQWVIFQAVARPTPALRRIRFMRCMLENSQSRCPSGVVHRRATKARAHTSR